MESILKILMLEDSETDAEMVRRLLKRYGVQFEYRQSMTKEAFVQNLEQFEPDVILADNEMPQFSATEALEILNNRMLYIPFILVTGTVSEEFAIGMIKRGADDYILKDRLERLPSAIEAAIRQRQYEKERNEATERLKQSEEKYRTLVEQAFDGIIIYSSDGRILDCNQSACKTTGYSYEELKALGIAQLLFEDDLRTNPLNFEILTKDKSVFDNRRLKRKDGSYVEMEIATKILPDRNLMVVGRDITEKIEAERKVRQTQENLQAIFDNAYEGFILLDPKGVIKAFNSNANQINLSGVDEEMRQGRPIFDVIEVSRREPFRIMISKVMKGRSVQYDRSFSKPGEQVRWISYSFNPVWKDNIVNGICITSRDITTKKLAREKIEFDHNNLQALINNTRDLMWSIDRDFNLITSNEAFDKLVRLMTGVTPVKGMNIFGGNFTEDRLRRYKKFYKRAFAGETFTETEHFDEPVEFWSEISFYPIYEKKLVIGTACFSRNITEQKKAQEEIRKSNERYETVAKATSDAVWDYDFTSGKTYVAGKGYHELFGYAKVNDYYESNFWESHIHPQDKESVLSDLNDAIADARKEQFAIEYRFQKANGSYAYVNDRFFIIRKNGKPVRMMGAMRDITIRKKAEEERLKNKMEEQKKVTRAIIKGQEKERNEMGRELHDNINQLLAAIKMKLGFCVNHYDKAKPILEQCVLHTQEVLTETRNLSHRMVMPRFAESSFSEELEKLLANYNNTGKDIRLEIKKMEEKSMPAQVKETLYRIAQEQLHNIDKHSKASEITLEVCTYPDQVNMLVTDNGVGFDTTKKRNGIGLINIMNRAESYHGSASIISAPGGGCKLFVQIPF